MRRGKWITRIIRFLFRLLARVEVSGLENVPAEGSGLIATNHLSRLDPPLVFTLLERPKVTALVADKYLHYPFFRWLLSAEGVIWINRESADRQAIKTALAALQDGWIVGIAPEGTRSQTGGLLPGKTGAAYLADKAQAPVIPAVVWGTERAFQELFRLRRPRLRVRFGQPLHLPPVDRRDRDAGLERNTNEIMARLAALLPPPYRGVYAGDPRLQELLETQEGRPGGQELHDSPVAKFT